MSGGVYTVLGAAQFSPEELKVPAELKGKTLKLKPLDGPSQELDAEAACASQRLRQLALGHGPSTEIEVPVSKAMLGKLVDYMQYHKDTPPSEVATPITADNIADTGVSKWDANFVKVDKDTLFELMYAAGTFDIRSLTFLCAIQAAMMMKGKSAEKLRKDFNLKDDLPGDEAERLAGAQGELAARRRYAPEENAFDSLAAVLHGLNSAAEKNGGLALVAGEEAAEAGAGLKSWRASCWRAVVMDDWQQLFNVPEDVRDDRDLMFTAVEQSRGAALHLASDRLKGDRALVLRAASLNGEVFEAAADSLKGDRAFVREVLLAGDGTALAGAAESLRNDRSLVLEAASKGRGGALKGATGRSSFEFALEVVARDAAAYKYAADELRNNKDFALAAARRNGRAVGHMPHTLRADQDVAAAALKNDPNAAPLLHAARREQLTGNAADAEGTGSVGPYPVYMGVPLTASAARDGLSYVTVASQKYIVFTAMSTITPNMGQSNYIAANAFMDKLPFYSRPEKDTLGVMWGTVGGMGMRFKAFGSQDFMNMTPDNLLSINDCCKILHVISTLMDPPEWFAANFFDEGTRNHMLAPTAGMIRGESAAVPRSPVPAPATKPAPREEKEREADRLQSPSRREAGPLGAWPQLAGAAEPSAAMGPPGENVRVGADVVLVGIKNSMNGATGKVLQVYPEGKCRVALSSGKGNALLRPENLQVVLAA